MVVKTRPVWKRLSARLRLAAAPPILDAYLEPMAEPQAPVLDGTGWVDRTRPLDGVLEPAGAPDLPALDLDDTEENHQG